jgi:hypothetical protein
MKDKKMFTKAVVSVSELSSILGISRSRFYQLLAQNVFPQPLYDIRTRRPFYSQDLRDKCMEIKETGIAFNGQYILFYTPRKNPGSAPKNAAQKKGSKYQDIKEALVQMGLDVSEEQVSNAVADVFPEGIENRDQGMVLRELFRYFKKGL